MCAATRPVCTTPRVGWSAGWVGRVGGGGGWRGVCVGVGGWVGWGVGGWAVGESLCIPWHCLPSSLRACALMRFSQAMVPHPTHR
jgi:hypothetical protein